MVKVTVPAARITGLLDYAVATWRRGTACLPGPHRRQAAPRHLRPVLVPASLNDLRGPSMGVVELPVRLYWSAGSRKFDLSDPDQVAAFYDATLDAAATISDITTFLNADLLLAAWPVLSMGHAKREAWENRFPVLRRQRLAAAA